jgi:hypothetical protein
MLIYADSSASITTRHANYPPLDSIFSSKNMRVDDSTQPRILPCRVIDLLVLCALALNRAGCAAH